MGHLPADYVTGNIQEQQHFTLRNATVQGLAALSLTCCERSLTDGFTTPGLHKLLSTATGETHRNSAIHPLHNFSLLDR